MRRCLRRFFEAADGVAIAAEAKDPKEGLTLAMDLWRKGEIEVVVVSLEHELVKGRGLITALGKDHPEVPILAVDERKSPALCELVRHLGAAGYVTRENDEADLLHALEAVVSGKTYGLRRRRKKRDLTKQQLYVIREYVRERETWQIAQALGIKDSTVRNHKSEAMKRLGLTSDIALVRYAVKSGLCSL